MQHHVQTITPQPAVLSISCHQPMPAAAQVTHAVCITVGNTRFLKANW